MAKASLQSAASPGRVLALLALQSSRGGKTFVSEALDQLFQTHKPASADAHLATELALGVSRWRLTLRELLAPFVHGSWQRLQPALADSLLLAAYQVWMLDRIPDHAAVSESVALAAAWCGRRAAGLANAALRNMLRQLSVDRVPAEELPADDRSLWRDEPTHLRFNRPVFPDPQARPFEHLSVTTSHPLNLVRHWVDNFGLERACSICQANQCRPPIIVRANPLRCTAEQLQRQLADEGVEVQAHQQPGMLVLTGSVSLGRLDAFAAGLFQPQDPTSAQPVLAGRPKAGETVLDLCAAPGGKATQAAELMADVGLVIACDVSERKLGKLQANAERLGIRSIRCIPVRGLRQVGAEAPRANLVIVDVPCSNTGVLARRPEARYRFTPARLRRLVNQAEDLLRTGERLAKPAGRLVYSTCSIEPEENGRLVEHFCGRHAGWRLAESRLTLPDAGGEPTQWHDGGYWALLVADR
jgi:16S rRNA (cytosine967-C5)-methyltransferase